MGHQATKLHELSGHCNRRQPVLCGEINDVSSFAKKHRARQYDEGIGALSSHRQECAVELGRPTHLHGLERLLLQSPSSPSSLSSWTRRKRQDARWPQRATWRATLA